MSKPALEARKSFRKGCVTVAVRLRASGYSDDSVRVEGSTSLTSAEARELAATLTALADAADARVAAELASKERRERWIAREVEAGRMQRFTGFR